MGQFSKLPYMGKKLRSKSSISCTNPLYLPQGVKIGLMFALRAAVSEIRANFQTCYIWAWKFTSAQSARICTYTLFLPHGVIIMVIIALRAAVSEIRAHFQNCHTLVYLGMKHGKWPKFQKLHVHVYNLNYSPFPNFTPFCSMIAHFPDS